MTETTSTVSLTGDSFQERCRPHLNVWGPFRMTRDAVTVTAIHRFCEVAEDGNPVYWDEAFAQQTRFGRVIAPPQSLFAMTFPAWWTPTFMKKQLAADTAGLNGGDSNVGGSVFALCDQAGYSINTVASQEVEYLAPFGPGDGRLTMRSMVIDISVQKRVRVGTGVFVTTVTEYRTEVGDRVVGRSTTVLLRYKVESPTAVNVDPNQDGASQ